MLAAIIVGFLLAVAAVILAATIAFTRRTAIWMRVFYFTCLSAAAIAAYFTTYHYTYCANANTRFYGWPIPTVVFQRDGPTSPWLDFVGPTIILAYPINLILFALLPSILVVVLSCRSISRWTPQDTER